LKKGIGRQIETEHVSMSNDECVRIAMAAYHKVLIGHLEVRINRDDF